MLLNEANSDGELYFTFETYDASDRLTFMKAYLDAAGTQFNASYRFTYYDDTSRISQKMKYSDTLGTTLVVTYTYYDNADNRMKIKETVEPDEFGTDKFEFYDESFDHDGDGTNENYGRLYKSYTTGGKTFTYEAYYAGTDLKAKVIEEGVNSGTLCYFYHDYTINASENLDNEIGFRKVETNGDEYEYRKGTDGEYKLYKATNSYGTYWYLWDGAQFPGMPGHGFVCYEADWSPTGWAASAFKLNSENPMNPDVDWNTTVYITPQTGLPELGEWPPAGISVYYPETPEGLNMKASSDEPDTNMIENEEQAEMEERLAMEAELDKIYSENSEYTIDPNLALQKEDNLIK